MSVADPDLPCPDHGMGYEGVHGLGCDHVPAGIVHIAGLPIRYENHLRQRCAWCFAVLIDEDLTRIAVPVSQLDADGHFEPATWPIDSLVEVSGGNPKVSAVLDPEPSASGNGTKVPEHCCLRLPPETTVSETMREPS